MIIIGENIHIISKKVNEALQSRDEIFIKNLIKIQKKCDCIDINVGPAKEKLDKIFEWILPFVEEQGISFDSTNHYATQDALKLVSNPYKCFINSTTGDDAKMEFDINLAKKYGCNLIALTMNKEYGIPKTADERMEIVYKIYEKSIEMGINTEKLFFDPLILPVKVEQSQAMEALNTIRMVKESFDPPVNTIIGLSNISNGCPLFIRPLLNRVYAVMAMGAGLDAIILDAKDDELIRLIGAVEKMEFQCSYDKLFYRIYNGFKNFEDLNTIEFDKNCIQEQNIVRALRILLNEKVYSDNFTQDRFL